MPSPVNNARFTRAGGDRSVLQLMQVNPQRAAWTLHLLSGVPVRTRDGDGDGAIHREAPTFVTFLTLPGMHCTAEDP